MYIYVCMFVGKEMYVMSLRILKMARSILMSTCICQLEGLRIRFRTAVNPGR